MMMKETGWKIKKQDLEREEVEGVFRLCSIPSAEWIFPSYKNPHVSSK